MIQLNYVRHAVLLTLVMMVSAGLYAQVINITPGGRLIMSGSVKLVLHDGGFNNDGSFSPGAGTLKFTGAREAFISSNTTINLQHVTIDKSPGSIVHLRQDATI